MNKSNLQDLNTNYFDLYQFFGSVLDKWYLYFFYFVFLFGSIYINKEQRIYTISINNNNGPKEFILEKLSKEIKSENIDLTDERLYLFLKNELNERQLNTTTVKTLLDDIRYTKNKKLNGINLTKNLIDIYSVRNNLVSTRNVLDLLETNKKKFQEYDFELDIIDEASIDIILNTSSDKSFEISSLILLIKNDLSEYISSIKHSNLIKYSSKDWINLKKNNILYNFSYFVKYILIFIGVIITNIILNILDKKIFTINRSRFLLDREFDFILNNNNSNSVQKKLLQITKEYIESDNILFLIINSNKYLQEEINKYQKKDNLKKIDFLSLDDMSKIEDSDNSITIIFITGFGLHNTKEILELRTFLNNNPIIYKLKTIYLCNRLEFL